MNPDNQSRMNPLKRLRLVLADIRQLRTDVESWNANRTEHPPFDVGIYIVAERNVLECMAAWGSADFDAKCNRLVEYMKTFAEDES